MGVRKLRKEELTVQEYEELAFFDLMKYFTHDNQPTEQFYLQDDSGFLCEVSIFENEKYDEFNQRVKELELMSKKMQIMSALGF